MSWNFTSKLLMGIVTDHIFAVLAYLSVWKRWEILPKPSCPSRRSLWTRVAFLWQKFCQNHFGQRNCFKIHIRGCKWLTYQYKYQFLLFYIYQSFEFAIVTKKLLLSYILNLSALYISLKKRCVRTNLYFLLDFSP